MLNLFPLFAQSEPDIILVTGLTPPFVHDQYEHKGFFNALLEEAFLRIGLDVEIEILPAARVLKNVNEGIDDGCVLRVPGLEKSFPNMIMVPEALFLTEFVGFYEGNTVGNLDIINLDGFDIAYINGWKIFENSFINHKKTLIASSPEQLFEILSRGRADYIFYEKWQGLYVSRLLNLTGIRIAEPALFTVKQYMYLNKKHANIIPILADSIKEIKADGTYDKFYKEYLEGFLTE